MRLIQRLRRIFGIAEELLEKKVFSLLLHVREARCR
jgi:hypothetical protein